jgi:hypothetical protein
MRSHRLVMPAAMLVMTMLVACSNGTRTASNAFESPALLSSTPSQSPASPCFSGLPVGTYPVHVHSICSGRQNFHITVVQSLGVGSGGRGTIDVPSSYFSRGLCLIVYTGPSLSAVLTTRSI